jgi:hypothetical protein
LLAGLTVDEVEGLVSYYFDLLPDETLFRLPETSSYTALTMSFSTKNALSADVAALEAPDIIHTNALTEKGVVDATEGKLNIGADESAENEFAKEKNVARSVQQIHHPRTCVD